MANTRVVSQEQAEQGAQVEARAIGFASQMRAAEETVSAIRGTIAAITNKVKREMKKDGDLQEAVKARKAAAARVGTLREPYVAQMDKLVATLAGQTLTDPKTKQPVTVANLRTWVEAANDQFNDAKAGLYGLLPASKGISQ